MIIATNWRPLERNSLRGFVTLKLPGGLVLRDCTLHERNGKRWIGLPGKPQLDNDERQRRDPVTGKAMYINVVDIEGWDARERFKTEALEAIDRLLGGEGEQ